MSRIRVLPEQLANRIAAGEVVERPASVVKELIENSLDSGADRIEIEVEGGGSRLIRVIDNGEGMDEDDVLLCLERHGTSKITGDHDLEAISSLGFRGEAIPSISSVSRMTIISRERSADFGTTAALNYGKLMKIHECGCSPGTIMEIRNLFGNTPARKKFLRTRRTELGHIEDVVKSYALAADRVTFILRVDNRETLHLGAEQDLSERLASIIHYTKSFIEIGSKETGSSLPRLTGLLVPPDEPVAGSSRVRILVNGRAVKDRVLTHAVSEGLRGFLMKGKSPSGLIHLQLNPAELDVNVHPTKQEVRFRRSRDIHQFVVQGIQTAIHGYQQTLQETLFKKTPPTTASPTPGTEPAAARELPFTRTPKPDRTAPPLPPTAADVSAPPQHLPVTAEPEAPVKESAASDVFATQAKKHHELKVVGQFNNLYIFCQSGTDLLVIDQHAAHERLLFEKLKNGYTQKAIARQSLLFPETVELTTADMQTVSRYEKEIATMGFSIREFGGSSYVISAVPALGGHHSATELFLDILEQFANASRGQKGSLLDDVLASMACKAAVKAGDELSGQEIEALLDRMVQADLFSHCPHGRPVLKVFSDTDIKKWFHRS